MQQARKLFREFGALAAFVVLATFGGIALDRASSDQAATLYASQQRGCARGNVFRTSVNQRLANIEVEREAFLSLLTTAEAARYANYTVTHLPSDLKAAKEYGRLETDVRTHVVFVPFPMVNCAKVYPKP